MASLQELESALVKADAAGDADAARAFAGEIRRMRSTGPETFQKSAPVVTLGPQGMKESIAQTLAEDVSPFGAKIVGGIGTAVNEQAARLKQLFGGTLSPAETADVTAGRQFQDVGGLPAVGGNIAGHLALIGAPMASLAKGATLAAGSVLPKVLAPALAPTIGGAVAGGAQAGLTQPVLEGESTASNVGYGMAGGALGDVAARGLARVVQPIVQSEPVKRLLSEGIVPTPGQAAGGVLNRIEQKAESIVGPGDFIRLGRDRAGREFNTAFLGKGLPNGGKVSQIGPEGINEVKSGLSAAYDKIFSGKSVSVSPTSAIFTAIDDAKNAPVLPLNAESVKQFDAVINKAFKQRIPSNGQLPAGEVKKQIIGDIGKAARELKSSSVAAEKSLGDALYEARNRIQDWLTVEIASTSPQAATQLAKIDPAYARMRLAEKAVERAKGAGGQFTPFQAQSVTQPGSTMRAFASDAQEVLGNRVPNSGSIDRAMVAGLLGLGGAGINEYYGGPGFLSALALAPLLYSRAGSRYMIGDLIPGQAALSGALRQGSPFAAQIGGLGILDSMKQ